MMTRVLVISDEIRDVLRKLVARAAERPTRHEDVLRMAKMGPRAANTENPLNDDLTLTVPHGYRITYTEEYQRPDVRCRHVSVSLVDGRAGTGPNPEAVRAICEMIGFKNDMLKCAIYVGTLPGERLCINVVEPVDGDMSKLARDG